MKSLVRDFIRRADRGGCVYLYELREAFSGAPEKIGWETALTLGGTARGLIELPLAENEEEKAFLREYFHARVYNLISVLGGRGMTLTVSESGLGKALCDGLPEIFDLMKPKGERTGYGKCLNVTDRINAALGCAPFLFRVAQGELAEPSLPGERRGGSAVPSFLRAAIKARSGRMCGMDVGGTDIKAVATLEGRIRAVKEFDWHPAALRRIGDLIDPILLLARVMRAALAVEEGTPPQLRAARDGMLLREASREEMLAAVEWIEGSLPVRGFDALGVCFPDVVVDDMIVGGETLKTRGIREHSPDYEKEFPKLTVLRDRMKNYLAPGGSFRMTNDGSMAAYTAAVELANCPGGETAVLNGIFAHTLGTELGTGWIDEAGEIPQIPLEVYNCVVDLGNRPAREFDVLDLRSTRNFNTALPGTLQKYASQSGAYRLAFKNLGAAQLGELHSRGFVEERGGGVYAVTEPSDMRKPLLEHLMALACGGLPEAEEIFREIGESLAAAWAETEDILRPSAKQRVLFGRFVKTRRILELMQEGAARLFPVTLLAADDSIACTALMADLKADPLHTVAQFGQAVGAVHYAAAGRTAQ